MQAKRAASSDETGAVTVLPFAEAARGEEQWEVCRMFLAALQLTNSGNVELIQQGNLEEGNLSLDVKLLTTDNAFDFSQL